MRSPDKERLRAIFAPGGALSGTLPDYEFRESQVEMALEVWRAFSTSRCALVESGTGTGKSIAYLVPAILWARTSGEKVVISTNTINLQEQLMYRDLPLLSGALGFEFRYTLVKGRSNYLCRRKAAFLQGEAGDMPEEMPGAALADVLSRLSTAATGSKSDFETEVPAVAWARVASDSRSCLRSLCPHVASCFFLKARSEMEAADILITNHHLLFSDLALRLAAADGPGTRVLPDYRFVVLDEAHNIPAVAAEHLGQRASLSEFREICQDLVRTDALRGIRGGLLPRLRRVLSRALERAGPEALRDAGRRIDAAIEATRRLREAAEDFFESVRRVLGEVERQRVERGERGERGERSEGAIRLTEELASASIWRAEVLAGSGRVEARAAELEADLGWALEKIGAFAGDPHGAAVDLRAELLGALGRLVAARCALGFVIAQPDGAYVYWAQALAEDTVVAATPLDVAPLLRENLFRAVDSAVLTSATLAVQGDFGFFKGEVGLTELEERPIERVYGSPFDLREQALLAVPLDLPDPHDPRFAREAAVAILDMVIASRGRAFVLFTSIAMMRDVERAIRPSLDAAGIRVFVQGELPRHRMLALFREEPGVLLGAESFWQGVDVPGEALSCVILTRLPFRVPTDPLVEAKTEAAETQGGSGFYSYSLPCAVTRFRQGFGRLIRSRDDKGVVVVLDRRLVERSYGRAFISSLPPITLVTGTTQEVASAVRRWLA